MCFVYQSIEFSLCELWHVDVIGRRQYSSCGTSLDDVRAILDVEPNRVSSLIRRVDHTILGTGFTVEQAESKAGALITVASGCAKSVNGYKHARTRNDSCIDRISQTNINET